MKYISWFSCGATSAVATKLAIKKFGSENVRVCYLDTGSEHPDNWRFLKECEAWFGQPIEIHKSDKYKDVWEVWEKRRYIVGVAGAPCTAEMKRKVAENLLDWGGEQQIEILGYSFEERERVDLWIKNNNERKICPILVERGLTKSECLGMIDRAGIEVPVMYKLGYDHNNCIGCPKGQMGYWNKIRIDFPEVFERMAKLERKLDACVNKKYRNVDGKKTRFRVFLDELDPDAGHGLKEPDIQCGLICMSELDDLD